MTVVRRVSRYRRRSGFALLQVFCHHDAHGVAQTDFRQQIVKRGQLQAIEFALVSDQVNAIHDKAGAPRLYR